MITKIYIKDFAIIREMTLQLKSGFTVITGETGAGKSFIVRGVVKSSWLQSRQNGCAKQSRASCC